MGCDDYSGLKLAALAVRVALWCEAADLQPRKLQTNTPTLGSLPSNTQHGDPARRGRRALLYCP